MRVHDRDAHAFLVFESFESGFARIARGGDENKEIIVELALLFERRSACREEAGKALQGHVFERARGAVPQLEHVRVGVEGGDGTDVLVVEVLSVRLRHEIFDCFGIQIDIERLVDARCALGVRHIRERRDLAKREARQVFGHVEPASVGQPVDDGFGEGDGGVAESAGVDVAILVHLSSPSVLVKSRFSIVCAMTGQCTQRS